MFQPNAPSDLIKMHEIYALPVSLLICRTMIDAYLTHASVLA
jgi:hypothetical protein